MTIQLLHIAPPQLAYMCLGGFVVLFSMVSHLIKETIYASEVVLGTAFGVIIGPYVGNVLDPHAWGGSQENIITLEFMRVVLVTGVFAIGTELPRAYMKNHVKGMLVMVVPTMAFGWVIIGVITHALFPALDLVSALCITACLTPTDPVTCAAITRGRFASKHVPVEIRHILTAEAAANDGLAYPFLSLAIYLTVEASTHAAIGKWFLVSLLYQVIFGTVLGAVIGILFSKLMAVSHRRGLIDRESYIAQYLAISLFTAGVASTLGADDLLAAFAAGCAVSWDGRFQEQTTNEPFSSVIDYFLNCACFIYIGAWLPFGSYNLPEIGIIPWRLVVLVLAIIVLGRIPQLLLLYRWVPEITSWKEALFCGHFGPMGVSALFVSAYARTRLPVPESPPANQAQLLAMSIQPIVSFVVLGSIIVHGFSIPFFKLGQRVQSRTMSLTYSRTQTRTDSAKVPDWSLYVSPELRKDAPSAIMASDVDVERGQQTDEKEMVALAINEHINVKNRKEVTEMAKIVEENFGDVEANRKAQSKMQLPGAE